MDGIGFDRLVKALATSGVRRQALRASVGGALAATLAGINQAAEAGKKKKKSCPPCKKRKQGKCKKKLPDGTACEGGTCQDGKCVGCSDFTESCASSAECCGAEFGIVACREHLTTVSKATCKTQFPGQRCCGLAPSICNPANGNCDCCDDLICDLAENNQFRCQIDT